MNVRRGAPGAGPSAEDRAPGKSSLRIRPGKQSMTTCEPRAKSRANFCSQAVAGMGRCKTCLRMDCQHWTGFQVVRQPFAAAHLADHRMRVRFLLMN
jgi:hypothetical protein